MLNQVLAPGLKGFPHVHAPVPCASIGELGWNVLDGRLPLPLAVIKRTALEHNLQWMRQFVAQHGIELAPHGKTTMSPQLFTRQLDAGAWGLTFANVTQLAVGVAAGVRRALIANQVFGENDLAGIQGLLKATPDLRVVFLIDSTAQLDLVEAWFGHNVGSQPFEVMLEIGIANTRTGCRTHEQAVQLAGRLHASAAVRLVGIECYEGLGVTGRTEDDVPKVNALMDRVDAIARHCDSQQLFDADEILVSAGGSSIFDLVAGRLRPTLGRPVRGLLRSGCYVTHDHGHGRRMMQAMQSRSDCGDALRPALEVWAHVLSRPEPGLALLSAGRRDLSFDVDMPFPLLRAQRGSLQPTAVPDSWKITALNDQHAYLRWDAGYEALAPVVGERIALGISHPCTTFDKWQWMPIVEDDYRVTDAVTIHF